MTWMRRAKPSSIACTPWRAPMSWSRATSGVTSLSSMWCARRPSPIGPVAMIASSSRGRRFRSSRTRALARHGHPRAWNEFREIRFSICGRRIARSLLGDRKAQRDQPRLGLDRARRPAGRQAAAAWLRPDPDRARSQPWSRRKGEDRIRRRRAADQFEDTARFAVADRGESCGRHCMPTFLLGPPKKSNPDVGLAAGQIWPGRGRRRVKDAGRRVLIVEDEAMIAGWIESILRKGGWLVVGPVATLKRALETIARERLDAA